MMMSSVLRAWVLVLSIVPVLCSEYLSPTGVITSQSQEYLYIINSSAKSIVVYNVPKKQIEKTFSLNENPSDIALSNDGESLYITTQSAQGKVLIVSLDDGTPRKTISVGHTPMAPIESTNGKELYVCNRFNNSVSFIDLASGVEIEEVSVVREPVSAVLSQDGTKIFVANLLPNGPADGDYISANISVIDTEKRVVTHEILLPNGTTGIRKLTLSPDGMYIYATHTLARYQVPTTQLTKGWMNTNALSIIATNESRFVGTVLLDQVNRGAANPWGVQCTTDGKRLCVTHAGTHEISVINRLGMHDKLDKVARETQTNEQGYSGSTDMDLSFLVGLRNRIALKGRGPRGLALVGSTAYVTEYFSGTMSIVDINAGVNATVDMVSLGNQPPDSVVRKGEFFFNDASRCFQNWQSCTTCHPDSRVDGLNWDILNDGIGNPKNVKNMLYAHRTPPTTATGIRANAEVSVRAGFTFIEFTVLPEDDMKAVDEYLKSMRPTPSPYLVNNALSPLAEQGAVVFKKERCHSCHSGPLYTDMKLHEVGTGKGQEEGQGFDTPSLIEMWRTAPYLHDGRYAEIKELIKNHNPRSDDDDGLNAEEVNQLAHFLLSL